MAELCRRLLASFLLLLFAAVLHGQEYSVPLPALTREFYLPHDPSPGLLSPVPPVGGSAVFPQMVHAAGMIFSGRVTSVGHAGSDARPASTVITFQVEQAIRGVSVGQNLTIHEWAGLWNSGERYRVGERVLLFLYPPSKFGLTSPVAGSIGRFAIDSHGMVRMTPQHVAALQPDPVLGGRTFIPYKDFAQAVLRFGRKE